MSTEIMHYCPIHGDLLASPRSPRCAAAPDGHEITGDYEAGHAEGFHLGISSPRGGAESDREFPRIDAEMIERAARAAAKADASDCFDRIDEWEGLEQWQRDASPNEYPDYDHEDAVFWRSIAKAALVAAFLTVQPNPTWELADKAREGIRERDFSDQITILNAFLAKE